MGMTKGKGKGKKGKGAYPPVRPTGTVCFEVPIRTFRAFCEGSVSVSPRGVVKVEMTVQQWKTLLAATSTTVSCQETKTKNGKNGKNGQYGQDAKDLKAA